MPVPEKVLLAIPCMDFRIDIECVSGLLQVLAAMQGAVIPYFRCGQSNIRLCRNEIAHYFKTKTDCDTLVWVDSDIRFTPLDLAHLLDGEEDLVWAPYAKKRIGLAPVEHGFVRLHRSVLEKMDAWLADDESEALGRFMLDGELAVDYFFDGATPDGRWFSEDTGFFHWCAMLGIKARKESRCRLGHVGRFVYGYPDQTPGLIPIEEGAQ